MIAHISESIPLTQALDRGVTRALLSAALTGCLLAAPGCSHREVDATPANSTSSAAGNDDSRAHFFSIPDDQKSHVEVVAAEPSSLPHVLRLPGTVAYNSFETTPVISQVSGPISRILIVPGQEVHAGQPMLYVTSPDFAQLRTNYLKARDAQELAQKAYARSKDLYDHHVIALADLEQAESTQNQAQADLQAADQALRAVGVPHPDQMSMAAVMPEIPVLAPISGQAVERLVAPGQVIQAGATQIFTISNMSTVWVLASVYERDLGAVHNGEDVSIESDAYPEKFHGKISYLGSALDPTSHTLQVRIVTDNPGEKLKKDMYVTATIQAGNDSRAMTVPDAAVLRDAENLPFVYVEAAPNQFAERQVEVGESENGKTQVLSGLQAGENVIADGSLFLQFQNSYQH
jgi:cobalt-zinc-cadmium efflux system membrane fusion protein